MSNLLSSQEVLVTYNAAHTHIQKKPKSNQAWLLKHLMVWCIQNINILEAVTHLADKGWL